MPLDTPPLHPITGQFRDAGVEAEFRMSLLAKVQQDSRLALTVAAAGVGVFAISDYNFLGASPAFYLLAAVRSGLALGLLTLALTLSSSTAFVTRPWLYSIAPLLVATCAILLVAVRPHTLPTQLTSTVVIIMGVYLFGPNLLWGMIGTSLYLSAGFLLAAWRWGGLNPVGLMAFGLLLGSANVVGYLLASRHARLLRDQFILLKEERLAKHRLMDEVARRVALEQRLRSMAQTDELTGLSNRRHFLEIAQASLKAARRQGQPFSLCMIDVDHFKTINDAYGHDCGDQVLRAIAQACRQDLREGEPIGRFGGEEFVAALPSADLANARAIADRLRQTIAELQLEGAPKDLRVTVTIGVSEVERHEMALDDALKRADAALYEGKRGGRNVVRSHGAASKTRRVRLSR